MFEVDGVRWDVLFTDQATLDKIAELDNVSAVTDYDRTRVFFLGNQSSEGQKVTFFHELMHILFDASGMSAAVFKSNLEKEEPWAQALGTKILSFIRANRELVDYLATEESDYETSPKTETTSDSATGTVIKFPGQTD